MKYTKAVNFLKNDRDLVKLINQIGEFEIKFRKNRYQTLVESIITQQLSGSAASSIILRFKKLYHNKFPKPIDVIKTSNLKLRSTGLSKMKVEYIKGLSKKIESKEIKFRSLSSLNDEQIIDELTKIRGIGRWTAEMFLIFSLGRLDVFPMGDLGLKKGIRRLYSLPELPNEEHMKKIGEKWRPYRTIATWYIWKTPKSFDNI